MILSTDLKGEFAMFVEKMRYELAEYYECAGFADVYNRVIKHKTDNEIISMYKEVFEKEGVQIKREE